MSTAALPSSLMPTGVSLNVSAKTEASLLRMSTTALSVGASAGKSYLQYAKVKALYNTSKNLPFAGQWIDNGLAVLLGGGGAASAFAAPYAAQLGAASTAAMVSLNPATVTIAVTAVVVVSVTLIIINRTLLNDAINKQLSPESKAELMAARRGLTAALSAFIPIIGEAKNSGVLGNLKNAGVKITNKQLSNAVDALEQVQELMADAAELKDEPEIAPLIDDAGEDVKPEVLPSLNGANNASGNNPLNHNGGRKKTLRRKLSKNRRTSRR